MTKSKSSIIGRLSPERQDRLISKLLKGTTDERLSLELRERCEHHLKNALAIRRMSSTIH